MKKYEKPVVEVVDFSTEAIMDDELGDGLGSPTEGWE